MRIRYEDMLEHPVDTLAALADWLDLGLASDRIREAVSTTEFGTLDPSLRGPGRFARAATPGLWRENLSPEEQAAIIEILGPKLSELGYD